MDRHTRATKAEGLSERALFAGRDGKASEGHVERFKSVTKKGYSGIYATHKYWGKKPPELCQTILENFSEEGEMIVDPFMGSGVMASLCRKNKRHFKGSDINPAAISIATMFTFPPEVSLVEGVFQKIKVALEEEIRKLYFDDDGNEVTHIIRENDLVKEVWIANGKQIVVGKTREIPYTLLESELNDEFFGKRLFSNSRINVSVNQNIDSLFTKRAQVAISKLLSFACTLDDKEQAIAKYILTSSLGQMSKMVFAIKRRQKPKNQENQKQYEIGSWVIGYWRPKLYFEVNVWRVFEGRSRKLINALKKLNESELSGIDRNKTDSIRFSLSDGFVFMDNFKSKSVDLIVTDPPHNDRIPYLELSEIWNGILQKEPDYNAEWVISNSPDREKTKLEFLKKFDLLFKSSARILKSTGYLILMYNTKDTDFWKMVKEFNEDSKVWLNYVGKFRADYSAGSVVQDNRKGALKHDWCLVFGKSEQINLKFKNLPGWTVEC